MDCLLVLDVPVATAAQLARGVAAAETVFKETDVSPSAAFLAFEARRAWIDGGFQSPGPSRGEMQAAATFALARRCAIAACTGEAGEPPGCVLSAQRAP